MERGTSETPGPPSLGSLQPRPPVWHLFDVYGVELEYMIVRRGSLEGADRRGVPLRPLLRLAELSPDALDGDDWVASEQFARLLQAAGHTMRDEGVGFLERPIRHKRRYRQGL